jgi:hypothetical protein
MDATICLLRAILLMFFSNCCHLCLTLFGVTLSAFEAVYKTEQTRGKRVQWAKTQIMISVKHKQ